MGRRGGEGPRNDGAAGSPWSGHYQGLNRRGKRWRRQGGTKVGEGQGAEAVNMSEEGDEALAAAKTCASERYA